MQVHMASGVVLLHRAEKILYLHVDGQFLPEFAGKGLLVGFAGFNFPAGKLPHAFVIPIASLGSVIVRYVV